MEQPTNIVSRPLSTNVTDDRIRMVFGLTSDDRLPMADNQMQRRFLDYLGTHLSFPFMADYWSASILGHSSQSKGDKVAILGFAEPPLDQKEGIVCEARRGKHEFQVPLAGLQVPDNDPNFQHVEDYTYWLWEALDYEEEDDAVESP
jgi:hypothetical protein